MELFKLLGRIAVDTDEANESIDKTTDKAKESKEDIKSFGDEGENTGNKVVKAFSKIGQSILTSFKKEPVDETKTSLKDLTTTVDSQSTKLKELKDKYVDLCLQHGKESDEAQKCAKEIQELSSELKSNKSKLSEAEAEADKFDETIEDVGETAEKTEKKTSNAFSKMGSFAVKAGKIIVAGLAGASVAVGKIGKEAISAYGDYEQLVGGVETLFKGSSDTVIQNAENAYKTAGMSANEYMETVTGFSASLLQSLGGDTVAASKKADTAITDMADNANKMGTSMEDIQNAYQGFAKQNYTMLDNLKLGYGGTQKEMERLLADAEKVSGVKYDMSSYADIVDAIHVVQTEMGITGTTAKEASTTIQGSISSAKSAWQNLLSGLTDKNQNLDKLINNLFNSLLTVGNNLIPRMSVVLDGVVKSINKLAPKLIKELTKVINQLLPKVVEGATSLINAVVALLPSLVSSITKLLPSLINGINQVINGLLSALPSVLTALIQAVVLLLSSTLPSLIDGLVNLFVTLAQNFVTIIQPLLDNLPQIIISIVNALMDNLPTLIEGCVQLIVQLVQALPEIMLSLIDAIPTIIQSIVEGLWEALPVLLDGVVSIVSNLGTAIRKTLSGVFSRISKMFSSLWKGIKKIFDPVVKFFSNLFKSAWEGIKKAWNSVGNFFYGIWKGLKSVFSSVGNWFGNVFSGAWNGIKKAWNGVGNFFSGIWNGIKNVFSGVGKWFSNIFSGAWKGIKSVFSGVGKWFKNLFDGIIDFVKAPINFLISGLNTLIKGVNKISFDVPDWVPLIGGKKFGFDIPSIPKLAKGAVVDKPTPAVFGEDGAEAVVPLENNTGWIRNVAKQIYQFTVETKELSVDKVKDTVGEKKTNTTKSNKQTIITTSIDKKLDTLLTMLSKFFPEVLDKDSSIVLDDDTLVSKIAPKIDKQLDKLARRKARGVTV